ncbi:MAG: hypothetical protein PVJ57_23020 [Phycisphaerae bacterium]|jgi:hypothetical protein
MTYDPEQQRKTGHVPSMPAAIDERAQFATRKRRRGKLAERSGYGLGTTSTGAGSGAPGTGTGPASGDSYHKWYADSGSVSGLTAGHVPNGSRTTFDLEDSDGYKVSPVDNTLIVTLNGMYLYEGESYTISGYTITFIDVPAATDKIGGQCVVGELST